MSVNLVVRRKGDYRDARLVPLRKEGIALLKKHGASTHRFGYYHSGPHAGQMLVVVGYPDLASQERAMKAMSEDADWKRVSGEVEKFAPLQESYVIIVTEAQ
jgi:hypothetical protein